MNLRILRTFLVSLALASPTVFEAGAQTTITTASLTSLQSALTTGGLIYLHFNGTITATSALQVNHNTVLDSTGYTVAISGGNTTRIFTVATNINFSATNVTFAYGNNAGANGSTGSAGGSTGGGSI